MVDTISFYAADITFKGDKEGEAKVTLTIPATDIEQVAVFYAKNHGKRLGCALTIDESVIVPDKEDKGIEEVVKTEGEGE